MDYGALKKEIKDMTNKEVLSKKNREILERQIFIKLKEENNKCEKCWRTDNLNLDHIVPKDILKMFGMDTEREILDGNYRIMCRPCNSFKGNKLDFADKRTKDLLTELIKKI